jgi:hypothetical protein
MDKLEKALHEVITYNPEARKNLSNKDACKKCSSAIDEIIKLSEPRIAKIYSEMKRRGTVTGCPECVDALTFSQKYLELLGSPQYSQLLELGKKYLNPQ